MIVYILTMLATISLVVYMLLKQSQAYNEWLDERAYAQLTEQLSHANIEKIQFSIQQQVVQRNDSNIFTDIRYHGSLWNHEHTLRVGTIIITVVLSKAEYIFFYNSDNPKSNIFNVWYNGRTFAVEIPRLKSLANEITPLFQENQDLFSEQPSINISE